MFSGEEFRERACFFYLLQDPLFQSDGWCAASIMPHLWGQSCIWGLIDNLRKNEWADFFLSCRCGHSPSWQCWGSSCSNCERVFQGTWVQIWTPLRIFGKCWRKLYSVVQLSCGQYRTGRKGMLGHCISLSKWCHCKWATQIKLKEVIKHYSLWHGCV